MIVYATGTTVSYVEEHRLLRRDILVRNVAVIVLDTALPLYSKYTCSEYLSRWFYNLSVHPPFTLKSVLTKVDL